MNTSRMLALFKREMKDILRDKKTLIMMVVVPLLLYPLLIVGMTLIMSAVNTNKLDLTYKVALVDIEEETEAAVSAIADDKTRIDYTMDMVESDNPAKDLENKEIHAYVTKEEADGQTAYAIHYLSASDDSYTAADALMDAFEYYREDIRKIRVEESGLSEKDILYPISYELEDASTDEQSVGNYLGRMIPLLVITSICLGAIYPAIDVTAGERERGTLETLLTLPVSNFEMIMSKFMAVSVIASVSAVLNICSMGAAFAFMFSFIDTEGTLQLDIASFIPAVLLMGLVVIFFALFVTAISMCTCIFAKSFKEANNYITPVLLVFMFGGYSAMIPDLELTAVTAAIPIINMTQMIKSLFAFQYDYALFGIVLISNVVYSILTIMVLAKLYNSESVLFAEGFTSLKIFTKRSEMKKGQIAGVGDTTLLLCLVLLMMFYIGSLAMMKMGTYGMFVQQGLILLMPVAYAIYLKCDMKKMFSLRMPRVRDFVSSIFFFAGALVGNTVLAYGLSFLMKDSAKNVTEAFGTIYEKPFWIVALMIAVLPAIGEELLFRGFSYSTIRQKCKPLTAMLIISAVFGLYHMSLIKFLPTAILGFVLVLLTEKSKSIYPGMLLHFLNNLTAAAAGCYSESFGKYVPFLVKEHFEVTELLIMATISAVAIAIGCVILFSGKTSEKSKKIA